MRPFLVCFLVLLSCLIAQAQDPKPDPIDVEIGKMEEKDPSTMGMMQAIGKGIDLWDAQMNVAYAQLMKKLPADERPVLQKSQRAWLAYRDANSDLIGKVYGHAQGTMYRPMASQEILDLVKGRTLLLRNYLDLFEENSK